ncbi:helix-turn-helix domain-containing protein [Streptomyces flavofungini]|uniref:helix-turn-helix domain-containing protein n=1 Tax=Streptomyces flavofungini TaxID=68200 RepID=UPI0025AFB244|nr:helix-turn-helix domain-containing protein [Streptomyces flavofungini]WJV45465.1 helix-turn-helix domain-containing protein [Streptomyces flavofungini]
MTVGGGGGRGGYEGPVPAYAERPSAVLPGAVVWSKATAPDGTAGAPAVSPVLPDGCMDLLWTEGRLFVAGPDTHAYRPEGREAGRYVGIRFAPGTAPALLGVPAHELRDQRVELADLWGAAEVRRLTARVDGAEDPVAALEAVAGERAAQAPPPDPLLAQVVRLLSAGRGVAETAAEMGLGARQLHRRSLPAFGYGPKTLARVLRLQRALALARAGRPYADAAAATGFADQAHLARDVKDLTGLRLTELLGRVGEGQG